MVRGRAFRIQSECGLHRDFRGQAGGDRIIVWSQFQSLIKSNEMSDSKPLQDQVNKILTVIKDIVNGGITLDEPTQALLLMSKVPESYSTMVSAIMATTSGKTLLRA